MISRTKIWLFYLLFIPYFSSAAIVDLQDLKQDFVLETKRIEIPGYPGAFNPSLTRWNDTFLLTFRIRDSITGNTSQNGFVLLDDDLNIISDPKPLEFRFSRPPKYYGMQDPRIVAVGEDHYIVFNNQVRKTPLKEIRRMFIAKLFFDGERLYTGNPTGLYNFDAPQVQNTEKNWVPFAYNETLLLAYSLFPHFILLPFLGSESCSFIASTIGSFTWHWGTPRGGTPAIQVGDQYLAIFHSCKHMSTVNSNAKPMTHYFMGAYTFSNEPPFEITAMSPQPIVGDNFYYGELYKTWKPLLVVFPVGIVCDDNFIWVSYGRQDHEVWIMKLDKKGLLDSLKPVTNSEVVLP
jgi:predicted GH43/DUF377 family glycosyl hydrolase